MNIRTGFALLLVTLLLTQSSVSQSPSPESSDSTFLGAPKIPLITYGLITYSAATFYLEYRWWWEGNYHPFNFLWEGLWYDYSLGVDKIGYAYTSYL